MTLAGTGLRLVADFWMCTHHKAECGGMALTFPKTEQILKILMVLPGGTCCWHCGLQHERSKSILWLFAGFIFGVLVLGMLMEFIYLRDVKLAFAHKTGTAVTLVARRFL